ncbi:hypothetical protein RAS1_07700 [Phycisphaerae bacterium RAS1]|nr:hypothetical protein RAS1_07700 [Phycisphaerae bacterium RAS1]
MKSGERQDLGRQILDHIGRYRLTFQEILGALFFDGGNPQKTLNELRNDGLIESQPGFGGNRRAYKLTGKGVATAKARRRAADHLGSEALETTVAILSFCFLKQRSRVLLLPKERDDLLGTPEKAKIGRYHCLECGVHAKCVHHIYAPETVTSAGDMLTQTRAHLNRAFAVPELAPWLQHRRYVHTVLVEQPSLEADFNALLDESEFDEHDRRPIRDVALIRVERVPMQSGLEEALRVLAEEFKAA